MIYKFNRNGVEEEVREELWQWVAHFNDGTSLKQFDDNGFFHQIGEVDQSKLAVLKVFSKDFPQVYAVPFDPERMKLVYKYIQTKMEMGTENERLITSYCFGYQTKNLRENHQHLLIIVPNGEVIVCGDDNIIDFQ